MMELKVKATDQNLQAVNDFVHSILPSECSEMVLNQIDLAVEEIVVNIAHYAYDGAEGDAVINSSYDDGVFKISFSDSGKKFNPLERDDPDITLSAEERSIGGLGIFLTKKFMDTVEYEYQDGKNILKISKKI